MYRSVRGAAFVIDYKPFCIHDQVPNSEWLGEQPSILIVNTFLKCVVLLLQQKLLNVLHSLSIFLWVCAAFLPMLQSWRRSKK